MGGGHIGQTPESHWHRQTLAGQQRQRAVNALLQTIKSVRASGGRRRTGRKGGERSQGCRRKMDVWRVEWSKQKNAPCQRFTALDAPTGPADGLNSSCRTKLPDAEPTPQRSFYLQNANVTESSPRRVDDVGTFWLIRLSVWMFDTRQRLQISNSWTFHSWFQVFAGLFPLQLPSEFKGLKHRHKLTHEYEPFGGELAPPSDRSQSELWVMMMEDLCLGSDRCWRTFSDEALVFFHHVSWRHRFSGEAALAPLACLLTVISRWFPT